MECDAMNHLRLEIDQVDEMTELYKDLSLLSLKSSFDGSNPSSDWYLNLPRPPRRTEYDMSAK